jgi:hypothetical protein
MTNVTFDVESVDLPEWKARAERMRRALEVEAARAESASVRKAILDYLDDVAPCLPALEHAATAGTDATLSDDAIARATGILATVYESIVAFGDEIRLVLLDGRESEISMLPDILGLARTEREELADLVRASRLPPPRCARASSALQALAVTLVTVRVSKRAA